MALFDYRAPHKGILRKYKGCVGGIRAIDCMSNKPYFATVGHDRFLRVYNIAGEKPIQKMYLKSQLSCVLLSKNFDPCENALKEQIKEQKLSKPVNNSVVNATLRKNSTDNATENGEEFWTKLKVIKSGAKKSNGSKRSRNKLSLPSGSAKKKKDI